MTCLALTGNEAARGSSGEISAAAPKRRRAGKQLSERQPGQAHPRATQHLAARKSDVCVHVHEPQSRYRNSLGQQAAGAPDVATRRAAPAPARENRRRSPRLSTGADDPSLGCNRTIGFHEKLSNELFSRQVTTKSITSPGLTSNGSRGFQSDHDEPPSGPPRRGAAPRCALRRRPLSSFSWLEYSVDADHARLEKRRTHTNPTFGVPGCPAVGTENEPIQFLDRAVPARLANSCRSSGPIHQTTRDSFRPVPRTVAISPSGRRGDVPAVETNSRTGRSPCRSAPAQVRVDRAERPAPAHRRSTEPRPGWPRPWPVRSRRGCLSRNSACCGHGRRRTLRAVSVGIGESKVRNKRAGFLPLRPGHKSCGGCVRVR